MTVRSPLSPTAARAPTLWPPGPDRPRLGDGELHVWRADLDELGDGFAGHLAADELARAERIAGTRAIGAARWARCRGLLRVLLGSYLDSAPQALRFACGPHGKPELHAAEASLSFNVSHSGAAALIAVGALGTAGAVGAVGVDVESIRERDADLVALAARALGADDARRLASVGAGEGPREFTRMWVRHEALLKCRGDGIGAGSARAARRPWIRELELGGELSGAVACERPARELRCWSWEPSAAGA